ncbi:transcriptional regulator [Acinetobacter bereziniae]|uniref:transcriptional regulator n=1 Tax=Acinetobacter bereziniae TaxID=106648 RepID=UPI0025778969|nr:transcriptional regulator [Acinetobacter bereziniae]MDM1784243.1 transcriptional regulator [Acinetobacter bereziniae]
MSINEKFLKRGERLKAERKRLKMTQPAMAELLEVAVGSVIRYEKQGDPLNQNQLLALESAGFDAIYISFGKRAVELNDQEFEVIEAFRSLNESAKQGFVGMAKAYASQNNAT